MKFDRRVVAPALRAFVCGFLVVVPAAAQPPSAAPPPAREPVVLELPEGPPPGADLTAEEIDRVLAGVEAELDLLRGESGAVPPDALSWPDLAPLAELAPIRRVVAPSDRSMPVLTTTLRHTTLQLAPDEDIVDFVLGDSFYFDVRGTDNMAFVKPMDDRRRTTLSLVTAASRTYSFDLFSTTEFRPDEVLIVEWPESGGAGADSVASAPVPGFDPDAYDVGFVPVGVVADYRRRLAAAEQDALDVAAEAAREHARVRALREARFDDYMRVYPRRVQMRYRLTPEIRRAPLFVNQIWTDGQFTYLRSSAQESPALYSLTGVEGAEPVFVNFTLSPDGLYVVDHVLGAGYAQLHGARGEWHLWDVPPLAMLAEQPLPRGGPPHWVPTRSSKSWVRRHPRLTATLVGAGVAAVALARARPWAD